MPETPSLSCPHCEALAPDRRMEMARKGWEALTGEPMPVDVSTVEEAGRRLKAASERPAARPARPRIRRPAFLIANPPALPEEGASGGFALPGVPASPHVPARNGRPAAGMPTPDQVDAPAPAGRAARLARAFEGANQGMVEAMVRVGAMVEDDGPDAASGSWTCLSPGERFECPSCPHRESPSPLCVAASLAKSFEAVVSRADAALRTAGRPGGGAQNTPQAGAPVV
jgi:hypothetical protein